MSPRSDGAVIVFDGVCVLCNGWVRFLLRYDRKARYRFAAMQSGGARVLSNASLSFLLVDEAGAWTDTDAIGRVLHGLDGGWRVVAKMLLAVPRGWRDRGYRLTARNRYRWFGRRAQCRVPEPAELDRFLP